MGGGGTRIVPDLLPYQQAPFYTLANSIAVVRGSAGHVVASVCLLRQFYPYGGVSVTAAVRAQVAAALFGHVVAHELPHFIFFLNVYNR